MVSTYSSFFIDKQRERLIKYITYLRSPSLSQETPHLSPPPKHMSLCWGATETNGQLLFCSDFLFSLVTSLFLSVRNQKCLFNKSPPLADASPKTAWCEVLKTRQSVCGKFVWEWWRQCKCKWQAIPRILARMVWMENRSLWEGFAGSDPGCY